MLRGQSCVNLSYLIQLQIKQFVFDFFTIPLTAQFIILINGKCSGSHNILGWRRSYRVLTFIQTYFWGNVRTCVRVLCFVRYVTCTGTSTQAKATHYISVSCTSTVATATFQYSSYLVFSLCALHAPELSYQTISLLKMPVDLSVYYEGLQAQN